jgi:hypothetical protein
LVAAIWELIEESQSIGCQTCSKFLVEKELKWLVKDRE